MATWIDHTGCNVMLGPFVDSSDGVTPLTALTIAAEDVLLSKNGGSWASKIDTTDPVHSGGGWYIVVISSDDLEFSGSLIVRINAAGSLAVWREFMVVDSSNYSQLIVGSNPLEVDVVRVIGSAVDGAWPSSADNANAVWSTDASDYQASGSFGRTVGDITAGNFSMSLHELAEANLSAVNDVADDVWERQTSDHSDVGTFGLFIQSIRNRLPAALTVHGYIKADTIKVVGTDPPTLDDMNSEMVDVISVDSYGEPPQGAPPADASLIAKIGYLYKSWRNKKEQTSSEFRVYDDGGTTVDHKSAVSDAGGTVTRDELGSGP